MNFPNIFVFILVLVVGYSFDAHSAEEFDCKSFINSTSTIKLGKYNISSELAKTVDAHRDEVAICLIGALHNTKPESYGDQKLTPDASSFNRYAQVLAYLLLSSDLDLVNQTIATLRAHDSDKALFNLAYGARNKSPDTRLVSTVVLSNIVDNTSVCIVLDHLYDNDGIELGKDELNRIYGRANLIYALRAVAAWAYGENAENIARYLHWLEDEAYIEKRDQNLLAKTIGNKEDLERRLQGHGYPNLRDNKEKEILSTEGKNALPDCHNYVSTWANDNTSKLRMNYRGIRGTLTGSKTALGFKNTFRGFGEVEGTRLSFGKEDKELLLHTNESKDRQYVFVNYDLLPDSSLVTRRLNNKTIPFLELKPFGNSNFETRQYNLSDEAGAGFVFRLEKGEKLTFEKDEGQATEVFVAVYDEGKFIKYFRGVKGALEIVNYVSVR